MYICTGALLLQDAPPVRYRDTVHIDNRHPFNLALLLKFLFYLCSAINESSNTHVS